MAPSSAAIALRESFGDRKPPDITRKITACVACRKLKIKCRMNESKPPCSRCKARGLPCTVNKSIQMLLENDLSWKESMEQRIGKIEQSLIAGQNRYSRSPSADLDLMRPRSPPPKTLDPASGPRQSQLTLSHELPAASPDVTLNLSCSLGAFPASSMTKLIRNEQDDQLGWKQDLVSCGIISQEAAEGHFAFYQQHLDPYIHHILGDAASLADIRSRSSLLTAAVCTVAAFCAGTKGYQNCFDKFTQEVSSNTFSTRNTFDDVRALCIGALWLGNVSSALNALAVRMAAELDLHRCITKMPHTKRECYDRTRLYFLVYVCDHHCSLSHGRPPMTRELRSLKTPRALLRSEFSTPSDLRLISQVELWSTSNRVFDVFGADIQNPSICTRSAVLEQLSSAYDRWHQEWLEVLKLRNALDDFTRHTFELYFHSARLYLFSHVFRGPSQRDLIPPVTANGMDKFAQCAVESALAIIRCVVDENNAQVWLGRLPSYFGTTIAFASVFLLRAAWHEQLVYNVDNDEVFRYLHRLAELLHGSAMVIHPTHLLLSIANSLEVAIGGRGSECEKVNDPAFDFNMWGEDVFNLNMLDSWMGFPEPCCPPVGILEESL